MIYLTFILRFLIILALITSVYFNCLVIIVKDYMASLALFAAFIKATIISEVERRWRLYWRRLIAIYYFLIYYTVLGILLTKFIIKELRTGLGIVT